MPRWWWRGEPGFIIPPRDPESLVDRLRYLESHRDGGGSHGREGRRRVERFFSVERFADETLKTYREATSKSGPALRFRHLDSCSRAIDD